MKLALAGDTMLGRGVANALASVPPAAPEAVPLKLDYCHTAVPITTMMRGRFREECAHLGTTVEEEEGRLVVIWDAADFATASAQSPSALLAFSN